MRNILVIASISACCVGVGLACGGSNNAPFGLDRFRSGRLVNEAAAAAVAH